jgi:polar amino acid transport system substrate-binding protein
LLADPGINAVIIATRHNLHASLVSRALRSNKHVFVEKPLATTDEELSEVVKAAGESGRLLMVGFNRRFSPHGQVLKEVFGGHAGPLSMVYRINAGTVPADHWTQDIDEGGGRVVGEMCHFIDFLQFVCGSKPRRVFAAAARSGDSRVLEDDLTVIISFEDGSIGTVLYFNSGDRVIPKERVEVFGDGKTAILDDFRKLTVARNGKLTVSKISQQDKGQKEEMQAFADAVLGRRSLPVPLDESIASTLASFRILDSLRERAEAEVDFRLVEQVAEG